MGLRDTCIIAFATLLVTPIVGGGIMVSEAQVMQSSSYRIERDSINFAGGLSTSTNYSLESTAGGVATGDATSTSYNLRAGYQQMDNNFISLSALTAVALSPAIPGLTGGTSNGSTTFTVTTNSNAGYTVSIKASVTPALISGVNSIDDYVPAGDPDYAFVVGSTDSYFGYSPSGVDTVNRFKDDGISCNTGALETALACWDGLDTTEETIAQSATSNMPDGATTTVYFRVGIGGSVGQEPGDYTATTTITALSL